MSPPAAAASVAAMDVERFQAEAQRALDELPAMFRLAMENVVIAIEEYPTVGVLADMGLESPEDLLGLFQGWPLPERPAVAHGELPDMIHLYRRSILAYAEAEGLSVRAVIRHVLIHEIGHYFGYSDEEMAEIEEQARREAGE